MKHFDSSLCISIWKFIILKPYLSSLLFLVPDEKTGRSVWSSYVRTLNTCLKSKVRISFYVISSFCMLLNMWFVTNAWVFFYAVFYLFAIIWWVMLLRFLRQVGRKPKNAKIRKRMSWILSSSWPTWPE